MIVRDLMSEGVATSRTVCAATITSSSRPPLEQIGTVTVEPLLKGVPVGHIMSSPSITIEAYEPPENATRLMLERKIGSLPAVEQGRLVGMLTETDVLRRIVGNDACCADVDAEMNAFEARADKQRHLP